MRERKHGPILWDGVNKKFKIWLYEDELNHYKKIWYKYPHDPSVRVLNCTTTREISIECLDAHLTQYFMLMQQSVIPRAHICLNSMISRNKTIRRSEVRAMIDKFSKEYSKSHNYEYLGIFLPERFEGLVTQLCDNWLRNKKGVYVVDD